MLKCSQSCLELFPTTPLIKCVQKFQLYIQSLVCRTKNAKNFCIHLINVYTFTDPHIHTNTHPHVRKIHSDNDKLKLSYNWFYFLNISILLLY